MGLASRSRRPVSDMNVTPLVDVALVLLIVFMVLTPLGDKQMFMRVPEYERPEDRRAKPEEVSAGEMILTLLASGRVQVDRKEMTVEEAMQVLHVAYQGRPSKVLFFNAEDEASYAAAVEVLDRARLAGVNTIGMMTDPPLVPRQSPAGGERKAN